MSQNSKRAGWIMPAKKTYWIASLLALGCVGLAGCGGQEMADVAGRVVYAENGAAATDLAGYRVSFLSSHEETDGKKKRVSATGKVGKDGTFTMSTYAMNDGVHLGMHQVALMPPKQFGGEGPPKKPLLASRFSDPQQSGLTAVVEGDTDVVLEVEHAQ